MNSMLIKLYGFFAGVSLLAFLLTGQLASAQETEVGLSEKDQTRALNLTVNMNSRADAMNVRFNSIIRRIRFNAGWMKNDRGQDLPEAEAHLKAAEDLLQKNITTLETIYDETYWVVTSPDPKSSWPDIKSKYIGLEENLTKAHKHLADSLFILSEADRLWLSSSTTAVPSTTLTNASSTN